jgi:hypothetical protein
MAAFPKPSRWCAVYTPRDQLVHAVIAVSSEGALVWFCPAHWHGKDSRKFVLLSKVNCVVCLSVYTLHPQGETSLCHYVE